MSCLATMRSIDSLEGGEQERWKSERDLRFETEREASKRDRVGNLSGIRDTKRKTRDRD